MCNCNDIDEEQRIGRFRVQTCLWIPIGLYIVFAIICFIVGACFNEYTFYYLMSLGVLLSFCAIVAVSVKMMKSRFTHTICGILGILTMSCQIGLFIFIVKLKGSTTDRFHLILWIVTLVIFLICIPVEAVFHLSAGVFGRKNGGLEATREEDSALFHNNNDHFDIFDVEDKG